MKRRYSGGAALLVSLLILLVLSIIGISAMRGGLLQELLAANTQQSTMALNSADAGVEALYLAVNQEGTIADGLLDTAVKTGSVTRYVESAGTLTADEVYMDSERATPIIKNKITLTTNCAAAQPRLCPGFSADTQNVTCHVFLSQADASVADVNSTVQQHLTLIAPSC